MGFFKFESIQGGLTFIAIMLALLALSLVFEWLGKRVKRRW